MSHNGEFEWDESKDAECFDERGFNFAFASRLFEGEVFERIDQRHSYGEVRVQAIGHIDGLLYVVVYTMRGDVTRIISARPAHQKEWRKWLT